MRRTDELFAELAAPSGSNCGTKSPWICCDCYAVHTKKMGGFDQFSASRKNLMKNVRIFPHSAIVPIEATVWIVR
jgi:hypothetical protein